MLNLKKTALAVIALGSTAAFAGTMGPVCSAVNVTVPCENTAWDFGGRALYLQPTSEAWGQQSYVQGSSSITTAAQNPWSWGFQLEGSYHYSTGNDFNLNWYHFIGSKSTNRVNSAVAFLADQPFPAAAVLEGTNDSVQPSWDQVNMEFGQHVDFGENKFVRLHGGMNFSRVGLQANTRFIGAGTTTATQATVDQTDGFNGSYNGFGPRVGMDLNYEWGNGLGVYATGALSVLAGSSKSGFSQIQGAARAGIPNSQNYSFNHALVIPELDAKLGAMYTYAMAQGDLSLDVGWVWAHYTNALMVPSRDTLGNLLTARGADFGIQGLYFGMKWVGNVA